MAQDTIDEIWVYRANSAGFPANCELHRHRRPYNLTVGCAERGRHADRRLQHRVREVPVGRQRRTGSEYVGGSGTTSTINGCIKDRGRRRRVHEEPLTRCFTGWFFPSITLSGPHGDDVRAAAQRQVRARRAQLSALEVTTMRNRRDGERGVVAVLTAIFAAVLLVFTAVAVDIATLVREAARVQSAADAAALSGTSRMPDVHAGLDEAPRSTSASNGYVDSVSGAVSVDPFQIARETDRARRDGVVHRSPTSSAKIFGNPETTITRTAVADYVGRGDHGQPVQRARQPAASSGSAAAAAARQSSVVAPVIAFRMNVVGPTTTERRPSTRASRPLHRGTATRCTVQRRPLRDASPADHWSSTSERVHDARARRRPAEQTGARSGGEYRDDILLSWIASEVDHG